WVALIRGAFEYQGQKCSAASRAYIPASMWQRIKDDLVTTTQTLPVGDIASHRTFIGAVIDEAALRKHQRVIDEAKALDSHQGLVCVSHHFSNHRSLRVHHGTRVFRPDPHGLCLR